MSSTPNDGLFEWTPPVGLPSGTDYRIRISALDGSGFTDDSDADFTITKSPYGVAVDAPGLAWISSGNENWFVQSSTTYDGVDAAQAGVISHSQISSLETILNRPGILTFYWKVSSELDYDFLTLYINDVLQTGSLGQISGQVNWVKKTVNITTPKTKVRWSYTKDNSVSSGSDTAWLDQVVFSPTLTPFESWAGQDASVDSDTNSDGVPAGIAWVLGANSASNNASGLLPLGDNSSDPDHYVFTYRRSDLAYNDPATQIAADYASDMVDWNPAIHNGSSVIVTETNNFYGVGVDRVQVKIHRSLITGDKFFMRLRAKVSP